MKATIVQTSTPNPFANLGLFTGAESAGTVGCGNIVRFVITSDKMDIVDMRELSNSQDINEQDTRTPSVVNAWPITNVDLKYRVNLDGEKTNFYEENQELDWQVRQWVKVNFDKNDLSDVAGLGAYQSMFLEQVRRRVEQLGDARARTRSSSTRRTTTCSGPSRSRSRCSWPTPTASTLYGSAGTEFISMNRSTVTLNVMYSFVRAAAGRPDELHAAHRRREGQHPAQVRDDPEHGLRA